MHGKFSAPGAATESITALGWEPLCGLIVDSAAQLWKSGGSTLALLIVSASSRFGSRFLRQGAQAGEKDHQHPPEQLFAGRLGLDHALQREASASASCR
ncbi:MAG: hypothetical protein ACRDK2_14775 [Solirubrobacteraceae bacterium]